MTPLRIAVAGCTGRMGRAIVRLALDDPSLKLCGALSIPDDPLLGQDASTLAGSARLAGVPITTHPSQPIDVLIEFTSPPGCVAWADWCATNNAALVSGTTGLGDAARTALAKAANRVPIVWSANMSVGVNLLARVAAQVATALGSGWDIEIIEAHHRNKVDAPSGTAKLLLESICNATNRDAKGAAKHGRSGVTGARTASEIGVLAVRMGGVVGDHQVHFATPDEVVTLEHRALSRDTFAAGALRAAKWVFGRPPRVYSMADVLFPSS